MTKVPQDPPIALYEIILTCDQEVVSSNPGKQVFSSHNWENVSLRVIEF